MTSEQIYETATSYFGRDISKTRKRENIYARAIFNTLCRKHTTEPLDRIGKNTGTDHATVLWSLSNFNNVYVFETHPFNVLLEYKTLESFIKSLDALVVREVIEYKELNDRYYDLLIKFNQIKINHEELLKQVTETKISKETNDRFKTLIDECSTFTDKQLERFIQTRLRPFKLMSQIK